MAQKCIARSPTHPNTNRKVLGAYKLDSDNLESGKKQPTTTPSYLITTIENLAFVSSQNFDSKIQPHLALQIMLREICRIVQVFPRRQFLLTPDETFSDTYRPGFVP